MEREVEREVGMVMGLGLMLQVHLYERKSVAMCTREEVSMQTTCYQIEICCGWL